MPAKNSVGDPPEEDLVHKAALQKLGEVIHLEAMTVAHCFLCLAQPGLLSRWAIPANIHQSLARKQLAIQFCEFKRPYTGAQPDAHRVNACYKTWRGYLAPSRAFLGSGRRRNQRTMRPATPTS